MRGVGLNIKNPESEELIRELAAMRGVSLVAAVTEAVKNEIERERQRQAKRKLSADWLMEISRETAAIMNDGKTAQEVIDELYDPETGLPI